MFEKLGDLKNILKLKSQMEQVRKELDNVEIKVLSYNENIEITITGSQEIKNVNILTDLSSLSKENFAEEIKEAVNKAIKESQTAAAKKALGNMPGGFGL
jgi:DNA-binding protein YbaB